MDRSFIDALRSFLVPALPVCIIVSTVATGAFGQEGRRGGGRFGSPDEIFARMDRNGDGRLEGSEAGFMREFLQRQGMDVSRGVTRRDFVEGMERIRESMQRGGGLRRPEGAEGQRRDRRRGGEEPRGRERPISTPDSDADEGPDESPREAPEPESNPDSNPRPRVTVDLPSTFEAGDADGDGQIGMYEWRRWEGRNLSQFLEMDRNGDGFLTPREIVAVVGAPAGQSPTTEPIAQSSSDGEADDGDPPGDD